jgi:hypothetical protein
MRISSTVGSGAGPEAKGAGASAATEGQSARSASGSSASAAAGRSAEPRIERPPSGSTDRRFTDRRLIGIAGCELGGQGPLRATPGGDELAALAAAHARAASGLAGGPLGLGPAEVVRGPAAVGAVADRILVGRTTAGEPEVRMTLAEGPWKGVEIRLVAGARGIEATLVTSSEAARRAVEGQLTDLARALEARGLVVDRVSAATRAEAARRAARDRRADAEAAWR